MDMSEGNYPGFVLRHAAGMWNLLDLSHPEFPYKEPLRLNESGAIIWQEIERGMNLDAISQELVKEYGISQKEADSDLRDFCEKLKAFGVPLDI